MIGRRLRLPVALVASVAVLLVLPVLTMASAANAGAAPSPAVAISLPGFTTMATDPWSQQLFVATPNSILVFDSSGDLLGTIHNLADPTSLVIVGDTLYATLHDSGQVVAFSTTTFGYVGTLAQGLETPNSLVFAGGYLWTTSVDASARAGGDYLVRIDPASDAMTTYANVVISDELVGDPADDSVLFSWIPGESSVQINRVSIASATPTGGPPISENGATGDGIDNVQQAAVSPDGTQLVLAGGFPYEFDGLDPSTLAFDGNVYPAVNYPDAVAISAADGGVLVGGMDGGYGADLVVDALGTPGKQLFSYAFGPSWLGTAPGGVAISNDGSRLFAITDDTENGGPPRYGLDIFDLSGVLPEISSAPAPTQPAAAPPATPAPGVTGPGSVPPASNQIAPPTATALPGFTAMTINSTTGELFVATPSNILAFSPGGQPAGTSGDLPGPSNLVVVDDTLYATLGGSGKIAAFDTSTLQQISTLASGLGNLTTLVAADGKLWTTEPTPGSPSTFELVGLDPSTDVVSTYAGVVSGSQLASDPADPTVLFSWSDGENPDSFNRISLAGSSPAGGPLVSERWAPGGGETSVDVVLTPDGSEILDAAVALIGLSPTTLESDGLVYPGYNNADSVAVTAADGGVMVGGSSGIIHGLVAYPLDNPGEPYFTYDYPNDGGPLIGGLAFSPDGSNLYGAFMYETTVDGQTVTRYQLLTFNLDSVLSTSPTLPTTTPTTTLPTTTPTTTLPPSASTAALPPSASTAAPSSTTPTTTPPSASTAAPSSALPAVLSNPGSLRASESASASSLGPTPEPSQPSPFVALATFSTSPSSGVGPPVPATKPARVVQTSFVLDPRRQPTESSVLAGSGFRVTAHVNLPHGAKVQIQLTTPGGILRRSVQRVGAAHRFVWNSRALTAKSVVQFRYAGRTVALVRVVR
ncbi:MAG: hypothetical protein JWM85_2325 [Acidimicrobiaceae bacterium]|nr:hypothetical protein [Acidimicrobiaceae bacterium]